MNRFRFVMAIGSRYSLYGIAMERKSFLLLWLSPILVGGLEHFFVFMYWELHHPN